MISRKIYQYVFFGTCFRYLQDVQSGTPLGTKKGWKIIGNLEAFFRDLGNLDLQVSKRASRKLLDYYKELQELDSDTKIDKTQSVKLHRLMGMLRPTLDAELQGFEAYIVQPKRMDVEKLLNDVPSLFAPGVYAKLPDIAQYDLDESGKCIAFERPTASAFHLMRATEAILRKFYCTLVLRGRGSLMWGPMVKDLENKRKAIPYKVLLRNLDNIRLSFRNPTQHPEKIYDIHQSQDLWGVSIDVINRMSEAF